MILLPPHCSHESCTRLPFSIYNHQSIGRAPSFHPVYPSMPAGHTGRPLRCYVGYQTTSWSVKCRWSTTNALAPSLIMSQPHRKRRPRDEGGCEVYAAEHCYVCMTDGCFVSSSSLISREEMQMLFLAKSGPLGAREMAQRL